MPGKYAQTPLVEAICEFRFEESSPWDWVIPGLFYDRVKGHYPNRKSRHALEIDVQPASSASTTRKSVEMMQFLSGDGKSTIQIGPNLLAHSRLQPYMGWIRFKPSILDHLKTYQDIAQPKAVRRIGLRYINRIEIPTKGDGFEIKEYFQVGPDYPKTLPQAFHACLMTVEIPYSTVPAVLRLIMGTVETTKKDHLAFVLDFDMFTADGTKLPTKDVEDWVEKAHAEIEKTFEACITDKTRTLFGVPKDASAAEAK